MPPLRPDAALPIVLGFQEHDAGALLRQGQGAGTPVRPPPMTATSQLPCTGPRAALLNGSDVSNQ
jgi:hypothetical protein